MKRGVVVGIAVCLLYIASLPICVAAVSIYVNDALLALTHPVLAEGGSILVPIEGFGRTVGIETTIVASGTKLTIMPINPLPQRSISVG